MPCAGAREHAALGVIALSFFALAAFVTLDALQALTGTGEARPSTVGIVLAAASLAVMPSCRTRSGAPDAGSASADSKQTLLCTYLSAVLLVGLLANTVLGWSWADPIAALVIAAVAVREGINAWQGKDCCPPTTALAFGSTDQQAIGTDDCGCSPGCSCCS